MKYIIEWCNNNSGFIQSILACLTLLASLIAIVVSIKTSKIPYKKRMLLTSGSYIGVGLIDDGLHVTCINCGNRAIHVKKLGLLIKKEIVMNLNTIGDSQVKLDPGCETTQYFSSKNYSKVFKKFDKNSKVYAYAEDTEGTIVKKYVCRIEDIK